MRPDWLTAALARHVQPADLDEGRADRARLRAALRSERQADRAAARAELAERRKPKKKAPAR